MRSWRLEDGLPDNTVTAIAQTPDGYLWVGTTRGLARTDGVRFNMMSSGENVSALAVDPSGALWIGLIDGGISRSKNGAMERIVAGDESGCGTIHSFLAGTNGILHIGAQNGFFRRAT